MLSILFEAGRVFDGIFFTGRLYDIEGRVGW